MPLHPLTNGVYLGNNFPKINGRANVINLDEYKSIGTHWVALHLSDENITTMIILQLNIFQKKIHRKQKHYNKYLQYGKTRVTSYESKA